MTLRRVGRAGRSAGASALCAKAGAPASRERAPSVRGASYRGNRTSIRRSVGSSHRTLRRSSAWTCRPGHGVPPRPGRGEGWRPRLRALGNPDRPAAAPAVGRPHHRAGVPRRPARPGLRRRAAAPAEVDPTTGRGRLSYPRAEYLFNWRPRCTTRMGPGTPCTSYGTPGLPTWPPRAARRPSCRPSPATGTSAHSASTSGSARRPPPALPPRTTSTSADDAERACARSRQRWAGARPLPRAGFGSGFAGSSPMSRVS